MKMSRIQSLSKLASLDLPPSFLGRSASLHPRICVQCHGEPYTLQISDFPIGYSDFEDSPVHRCLLIHRRPFGDGARRHLPPWIPLTLLALCCLGTQSIYGMHTYAVYDNLHVALSTSRLCMTNYAVHYILFWHTTIGRPSADDSTWYHSWQAIMGNTIWQDVDNDRQTKR